MCTTALLLCFYFLPSHCIVHQLFTSFSLLVFSINFTASCSIMKVESVLGTLLMLFNMLTLLNLHFFYSILQTFYDHLTATVDQLVICSRKLFNTVKLLRAVPIILSVFKSTTYISVLTSSLVIFLVMKIWSLSQYSDNIQPPEF